MKNLFEEYGDIFIGIVTALVMLGILVGGAFIGTNVGAAEATSHTSKGVMDAMGYEASKTDIGTTARKEMITDASYQEVEASANAGVVVGSHVNTKTLFTVKNKAGKEVSYRVMHILDEQGDEMLVDKNVPTVGTIVFQKPGVYRCFLKISDPALTKIVLLHVTE